MSHRLTASHAVFIGQLHSCKTQFCGIPKHDPAQPQVNFYTWSHDMERAGFFYVTCSYCFVFQICSFFSSVFATVLRVLALAPKAFQLRGTFSFLPCSAFHVLVTLRPLQLSLSSKRLITVREPDSRGRGRGQPDRMMEGW